MNSTAILLCQCRGNKMSPHFNSENYQQLSGFDADVFVIDDLCSLSLSDTAKLKGISADYSQTIVLACHPRAVSSLFAQTGVSFSKVHSINIKWATSAETIHNKLNELSIPQGQARFIEIQTSLDVPVWFPIIDQQRCTHCGKCARFCLFGVYSYSDKKLKVAKPLQCKNLCPACARTCPASAIIFPKLAEGGVFSGTEPDINMNTIALDKGNLTALLAERNRKSILASGFLQKAEEERRKALDEVKTLTIDKE